MPRLFSKRLSSGFTLIELLISVTLMVILIGVVVTVFVHSSDVITLSEAKMEVYQNGRVVFDTISRDLSSLMTNDTLFFCLVQPTRNASSVVLTDSSAEYFMHFATLTSWRGSSAGSGSAIIRYALQSVSNQANIANLVRGINTDTSATGQYTAGNFTWQVLGQYVLAPNTSTTVANPLRFRIEYFDGTNFMPPVDLWTTTQNRFNNTTTIKLPSAVRVSMELCDRKQRVVRAFSRVIWIPSSTN